jgi:hypothetical protein
MKKTAVLLILIVAVSTYGFAETGFGVSLGYPLINFSENFDMGDLGYESFIYGIGLREKMAIFLLDVSLYSNLGLDFLYAPLDAGLCFDLFTVFRLGVGAGITAFHFFDSDGIEGNMWLPNIKVNADIKLGKLTLGVSGVYNIFINPTTDIAEWQARKDYLISTEAILNSTMMSLNLMYWFGDESKSSVE